MAGVFGDGPGRIILYPIAGLLWVSDKVQKVADKVKGKGKK